MREGRWKEGEGEEVCLAGEGVEGEVGRAKVGRRGKDRLDLCP